MHTDEGFYFAAVGDLHGHMHRMVQMIAAWEERTGRAIAFVLQVGDFEPHRDEADLATMAAPAKRKKLGDFIDFYTGRAKLPWPVYFIGGNHEPYGWLEQMPQGGEIVPNCHYLGRVGHLELPGLSVAGVSGIYDRERFHQARPGPEEFSTRSNKEYIHFNEEDIGRALDLPSVDILLLHEWPASVIDPAHLEEFERQRLSMRYEGIGNEYARMLMDLLGPKLILCGHMHKGYRNRMELPTGGSTNIRCLGNVEEGEDAVAFFRVDPDGEIEEIE